MQQANTQQPGRPGFPPNFQPPANMPNINFSAPVIRLGTSGPAKAAAPEMGRERGPDGPGRRGGLGSTGMDPQRHSGREAMVPVHPLPVMKLCARFSLAISLRAWVVTRASSAFYDLPVSCVGGFVPPMPMRSPVDSVLPNTTIQRASKLPLRH